MPFNRINLLKAISSWLSILQTSNQETAQQHQREQKQQQYLEKRQRQQSEPGEQHDSLLFSSSSDYVPSNQHSTASVLPRIQRPQRKPLKYWIPGLLVVPIPEAGPILGYVDIAYLAVITYIVGSSCYVADSFYLWYSFNPDYTDDASNPATYLNTLAAGIFVINALFCFLDWYLQVKQLSFMNLNLEEGEESSGMIGAGNTTIEITNVSTKISVYYFCNNLFFLAAAVLFLVQGIWQEDIRTDHTNCAANDCNEFWVNFTGGMFYLISSVFSCAESFEDRSLRRRDNLPQIYLFTWNWKELDWFGWGDIFYFLTAITSVVQPFFLYTDINDDDQSIFYLTSNFMFLIDSLIYLVGYMFFIYDMRYCLLTGKIPVARTASISEMIGDNFEGGQVYGRTSFSFNPNHNREYVDISEVKEQLMIAQLVKQRKSSDRNV